MASITIPENAVPCTAQQAFKYLWGEGRKIMATLTGEDGKIYATHVLLSSMIDKGHELDLSEFGEYLAYGQWYILDASEEEIAKVTDFINIYISGELVELVIAFDTQKEAEAHMEEYYTNLPFDPDDEAAYIWKRQPNGSYERHIKRWRKKGYNRRNDKHFP